MNVGNISNKNAYSAPNKNSLPAKNKIGFNGAIERYSELLIHIGTGEHELPHSLIKNTAYDIWKHTGHQNPNENWNAAKTFLLQAKAILTPVVHHPNPESLANHLHNFSSKMIEAFRGMCGD